MKSHTSVKFTCIGRHVFDATGLVATVAERPDADALARMICRAPATDRLIGRIARSLLNHGDTLVITADSPLGRSVIRAANGGAR